MRPLLCALALSLIALTPARADPQTGELTASPGAIASGMIGDADAEGVFEVVPDEHLIAVRHTRSGLVCRLDPHFGNRLVIYPQAARGEDVGCESRSDAGEMIKLIATRYSLSDATLDVQVRLTDGLIRRQFPDARPLPASAQPTSGIASRTIQFMVTRDGRPTYTRASIAVIGQWSYSLRYSVPAADAAAASRAEQTSSALWNTTLAELSAQHS
jgi:hypothetical protein